MPTKILTENKIRKLAEKYRGNLAAIGRACGCTRQSVAEYLAARPELKRQVTDVKESVKDQVENAFIENALGGNVAAQIFF